MLYLITILIAICQVTLVNAISIGNIKPDLLLVWVIFVALDKGAVKAAMAGILAGFLKDVFSAGAFINTLSLPACGIAAGLVTEKFYIVKEKLSVQLLIVFAACVLDVIVQAFYFSNWDYPPAVMALVIFTGIPTILYTSLVCALKYIHS